MENDFTRTYDELNDINDSVKSVTVRGLTVSEDSKIFDCTYPVEYPVDLTMEEGEADYNYLDSHGWFDDDSGCRTIAHLDQEFEIEVEPTLNDVVQTLELLSEDDLPTQAELDNIDVDNNNTVFMQTFLGVLQDSDEHYEEALAQAWEYLKFNYIDYMEEWDGYADYYGD